MNARTPIIQVRNLVARYDAQLVLDGISFDVRGGEILVVIGGSGCGKTTLLRHLVGLLAPAAGEIRYWGRDFTRMDDDERARLLQKIGIAFQSGALFNSMSVAENVGLPIEEYGGMEAELRDTLVRMKLSLVGLGNCGGRMPDELSGGMKKRVGFARAIVMDPEIVFFDEPSAGLDPITAAGIDKLILDMRRLTGATMVVVTHELESIRTVADRVLMLDRGRIVFTGTLGDASRSDVPRVRQFFGREPDKAIEARSHTAGGNG